MILRRTQKTKSLFRNFQITRPNFNRAIILRRTRAAVVVLLVARILSIAWVLLTVAGIWLPITRILPRVLSIATTATASLASRALLWTIIWSAILVRAVMSAMLMMSCTHGRF